MDGGLTLHHSCVPRQAPASLPPRHTGWVGNVISLTPLPAGDSYVFSTIRYAGGTQRPAPFIQLPPQGSVLKDRAFEARLGCPAPGEHRVNSVWKAISVNDTTTMIPGVFEREVLR